MTHVRVILPSHLRTLAGVSGELHVQVGAAPTIADVLDAVEASHPQLCGTIRDHGTLRRRAFMRYFTCGADWSHEPPDTPLPAAVAGGDEPFRIVAAIAGG